MSRLFSPSSFVGGIIIGALLAGVWLFRDGLPLPLPAPVGTASADEPADSPSGAISVTGQAAGDSVTLESVTVPPPGVWVAIREMEGTNLGNVLGALRVGAPSTNVVVPLLRATEPGRRYAVELYRDDGNTSFDLATDSVYVDFDTGERVVVYFTTDR